MKKNFFVIVLFTFIITGILISKPQYSNYTGNKCVNCHFNNYGGGQRNELGWYSRKDVSLIDLKEMLFQEFYESISETNSAFDGFIYYGGNYRLQTARLGGPEGERREIFSMQFSPYLAIKPIDFLIIYGHYNFVNVAYPAQQKWSAQAILHPSYDLPYLKLGYIQPSVGMRYDDHTVLVRQVADRFRSSPIIPPDYAELGAEINYESLRWLSLSAAVYNADNLSKIQIESDKSGNKKTLVDEKISFLARAELWYRFFDDELNSTLGSSYFTNGDFSIVNIYAMLGLTDELSLIFEYARTDKKGLRKTNNYLVELAYQLIEPIAISGRIEMADTDLLYNSNDKENYRSWQYVIGSNIYFLPYLELRPEYRIYDREHVSGYSSQWTMQLHLYY